MPATLLRRLELIANPKATTADLLKHIPGPDFPTGGVPGRERLQHRRGYETGRGGFRLRARWHKEDAKGGLWRIVVTEIPSRSPSPA
jgi:topoisomerase-4 subunit A